MKKTHNGKGGAYAAFVTMICARKPIWLFALMALLLGAVFFASCAADSMDNDLQKQEQNTPPEGQEPEQQPQTPGEEEPEQQPQGSWEIADGYSYIKPDSDSDEFLRYRHGWVYFNDASSGIYRMQLDGSEKENVDGSVHGLRSGIEHDGWLYCCAHAELAVLNQS